MWYINQYKTDMEVSNCCGSEPSYLSDEIDSPGVCSGTCHEASMI